MLHPLGQVKINTGSTARGILPHISHMGMCCPNGLVIHPFGLKTGIDPAHFGVESGMVFKGTTGVKNLFIVSTPN